MKYHPAAQIFPLMGKEDLEALASDIKSSGLHCPIECYEGQIIDGRNRWLASELAGVEPELVDVELDDPVAYVLSLNLHRRYLTTSQRAIAAARAENFYARDAKERQRDHGGTAPGKVKTLVANLPQANSKARDQVGELFSVSGRSVSDAKTVLQKGSTKLIAAVEADEVAVSKAARLATLPKAEQNDALRDGEIAVPTALRKPKEKISAEGKRAVRAAVKALRRSLDAVGLSVRFELSLSKIEIELKER